VGGSGKGINGGRGKGLNERALESGLPGDCERRGAGRVDTIVGSRGWFPRVAFNHPEAMNILFDGQFR